MHAKKFIHFACNFFCATEDYSLGNILYTKDSTKHTFKSLCIVEINSNSWLATCIDSHPYFMILTYKNVGLIKGTRYNWRLNNFLNIRWSWSCEGNELDISQCSQSTNLRKWFSKIRSPNEKLTSLQRWLNSKQSNHSGMQCASSTYQAQILFK